MSKNNPSLSSIAIKANLEEMGWGFGCPSDL